MLDARSVPRTVVVGAGVAGLVAAYRLASAGADVTVFEAAGEPGGKIRSVEVGGLRLEAGPDSLVARKPWAADLCRELGLGDDLAEPATAAAQVLTRRGLLPLPSGPFGISASPLELLRWPGLTWSGKMRAAADLLRRAPAPAGDESLGSLVRRRIGDEATDALVAPLLGGVFAGDVDRLSVLATFPELATWERRHGGLIRGARAAASAGRGGGRAPMFLRLRGGLDRLAASLGDGLGDRVRTRMPVDAVERAGDMFVVRAGGDAILADAVVFATPAFVTAGLVESVAPASSAGLRRMRSASTSVVLLVYGEGTGRRLPPGSGFLAPRGALEMTACTFVSRKWPEPAFGGRAVVRCFVGADGAPERPGRSDEDLVRSVARALSDLLGMPAVPDDARVVRWPRSMPQYDVGHLDLVREIERDLPAGVFVAGQAYRGVGVPDCVRDGERAARLVLEAAIVRGRSACR